MRKFVGMAVIFLSHQVNILLQTMGNLWPFFVNRLDVDHILTDTLRAIEEAETYSGYLRIYWDKWTLSNLSSTRRADDIRLLQYAFERGDHFLAYDLSHLQVSEAARLGSAFELSLKRMRNIGLEVKLDLPESQPASIHIES